MKVYRVMKFFREDEMPVAIKGQRLASGVGLRALLVKLLCVAVLAPMLALVAAPSSVSSSSSVPLPYGEGEPFWCYAGDRAYVGSSGGVGVCMGPGGCSPEGSCC